MPLPGRPSRGLLSVTPFLRSLSLPGRLGLGRGAVAPASFLWSAIIGCELLRWSGHGDMMVACEWVPTFWFSKVYHSVDNKHTLIELPATRERPLGWRQWKG